MAKILVTGGAGFIGSHLVDYLIEQGHEVYVIDNLTSGYVENINEKASFTELDFTDKEELFYYFERVKPDYVFHVGAWGRMPMCMEDPIGAYENNLMGTVNVLEASRRNKVKKVVLSSSCIVYCQHTPYWSTKVGLEEAAKVYREMYGLSTACLRYGNVYGERQRVGMDSAMFAMLKDSYNKEGKIHIFGDGTQTRDWVNVKDVCRANLKAALSDFEGEIDIATGKSISLNYIVEVLKKFVPKLEVVYQEERKGDEKHIKLSTKEAEEKIGFKAEINFEDAIEKVWNSL